MPKILKPEFILIKITWKNCFKKYLHRNSAMQMFSNIFISKKSIKSCYANKVLQPQKFVLCKFVLWEIVLAEGWLYMEMKNSWKIAARGLRDSILYQVPRFPFPARKQQPRWKTYYVFVFVYNKGNNKLFQSSWSIPI